MKEYEGTDTRSDEPGRNGDGNREAYLIALESTANENRHVVIDGKAPPGALAPPQEELQHQDIAGARRERAGGAGPDLRRRA